MSSDPGVSLHDVLARRTALVVVDMQNDYCTPEGIIASMGFDVSWADEVARRINHFIEASAPYIDLRVFLRTIIPAHLRSRALSDQYARSPLRRVVSPHLSEFFGVSPGESDVVVTKHRYSGFMGTPLDATLRANGIETLLVAGVTADVCVDSTVRDGFMLDYGVVVLSDCTEATTPERYHHTLSLLDTFFARVHSSEDVLQALASAAR